MTGKPARRGRTTGLGWRDVLAVTVVFVLTLIAVDAAWPVMSGSLGRAGTDKTTIQIAGQLVYSLCLALAVFGPLAVIVRRRRSVSWKKLGLAPTGRRVMWVGLAAGLAGYTIIGLIDGAMALVLGRELVDTSRLFVEGVDPTWITAGISFLATVAVLPILEELLFRGVLLGWLQERIPAVLALVVSALAFSAYHWNADYIASLTALGLIFGWVYQRTRSIWPAVIAHGTYNLMIDLYGFFSPD